MPFDFYKTIEIKTGGYPAEFGRATGGVINAVTKSGTNDFYIGVHGNYTPNFTRSQAPNTFATANSLRRADTSETNIEFGGPLWRDHLFFYGLYQDNNSNVSSYSFTGNSLTKAHVNDPFFGYKIDGYLTSRQHFEFTNFNTTQTQYSRVFGYSVRPGSAATPLPTTANRVTGAEVPGNRLKFGGNNYVAKYTGQFTDWFTISGAYGVNHDQTSAFPANSINSLVTSDSPTSTTQARISSQTSANVGPIDITERTFYRVDADIYANFLGKHHFRMGYDHEDTSLNEVSNTIGLGSYQIINNRSATNGLAIGQQYARIQTLVDGSPTQTGDGKERSLLLPGLLGPDASFEPADRRA